MPSLVKELMVGELEQKFQSVPQDGCVLIDYRGMSADDSNRVRASVAERGGRVHVIKNSLFALAMERLGVPGLKQMLDGPVAVVTAENPIAAAKAVEEAGEVCEAIEVRGAFVEGALVGAARVEQLAQIPGREQLLSMLAGALVAPLRQLAAGLLDRPRGLLSGLQKLRDQKEESE